jgi:hypothetical protein
MAHWRTMIGQREWFDVADLAGRDQTVQMESVRAAVIKGFASGRKTETKCVAVKLVGWERPLGVKATMAKSIVMIYGKAAGDADTWPGKWITLYSEMVPDPQGGKGAMCEAVRIRPDRPTPEQIAEAQARLGKKAQRQADATPARDIKADSELVDKVGLAIYAATTKEEVEAAIAPHRAELNLMDERLRATIASAKKSRVRTIEDAGGTAPPDLPQVPAAGEGAADA